MKANKLIPLLRRGDGSTLSLDFTAMSSLDSRFTFTRASTTSTFINSSGLIATAGTNVPRFNYDPTTLAPRGLLIEGSATNICLNGSMAFTATAPTSWNRGFTQCTVASVDSTTFLGQKAWSISATASGQRDLLEQSISLAANTTYTVSVYLEAVTGTTAVFAYMTSLPSGATSGTVVNPSAGRVSFTVTVGATAGNGTLRLGIGAATGTGVSADASVRFSHVQVEAGSGASSYIPTGASTVQRAADQCEMTGSNFSSWFQSGTPYTMLFKYSMNNPADWAGSNVDRGVGLLSASFSNPRVFINAAYRVASGSTDIGRFVRVFDSGTLDMTPSVLPAAASNTALVFAVNTNDAALYAANQSLGTDASCTLLTGYTDFSIGRVSGSSGHLNGCIRQIKYWPTRLPDSTLQSLTQ